MIRSARHIACGALVMALVSTGAACGQTARAAKAEASPGGLSNPLWSLPLGALTATRDRPLFSPSRRPDPASLAIDPGPAPAATSVGDPEQAPFTLVGTVVGDEDRIAVLVDKSSQAIVRLREGGEHSGWTLRSVEARSITLESGSVSVTLALPPPRAELGACIRVPGAIGGPHNERNAAEARRNWSAGRNLSAHRLFEASSFLERNLSSPGLMHSRLILAL